MRQQHTITKQPTLHSSEDDDYDDEDHLRENTQQNKKLDVDSIQTHTEVSQQH